MQYIFKEEELEIKYSWKERMHILFFGKSILKRESIFQFQNVFVKLISECFMRYCPKDKNGTRYIPQDLEIDKK
tara:strand:- start:260 stop:481 length:222 start_codon:yes stop_codon:yes gene_type:complete